MKIDGIITKEEEKSAREKALRALAQMKALEAEKRSEMVRVKSERSIKYSNRPKRFELYEEE